ncbi:DUF3951 domain-containing protein [Planococcus sp. 1R117A]|uniref:DUF3951 domain-containing protein n=1 Tax=Planococcus sp. 1R117A TaxID=3447020 RepID=UPI003EDB797C
MNPMALMSLGLPVMIIVLVVIALYKVFVKKKSVTPFYTPFDKITGQTGVVFHEEQEVHAEDPDQGDDKDR